MSKPCVSSEAELCAAFIEQMNKVDGWTCYPETANFDILLVHEDGHQIGVEAKLKLNSKVADQILPGNWEDSYGSAGPDHRLVLVGDITEASLGISRMLKMLGVKVIKPHMSHQRIPGTMEYGYAPRFDLDEFLRTGHTWSPHLFDWNPAERCKVPIVVPDVPAGVPSPTRLTPWKESAIQVLIKMRHQGYITAKEITQIGISPTIWTRGAKPWLCKGAIAGQWIETENLPNFQSQHPDAYAKLLEKFKPSSPTVQLEIAP